jgi:hypothetical protein
MIDGPPEHPGQPEEVLQPARGAGEPEQGGSYTARTYCNNCGAHTQKTLSKGTPLDSAACDTCGVVGGLIAVGAGA